MSVGTCNNYRKGILVAASTRWTVNRIFEVLLLLRFCINFYTAQKRCALSKNFYSKLLYLPELQISKKDVT
jgi:hypothetical protein